MLNLLSKYYNLQIKSANCEPFDAAIVMPDYYLYLYRSGDKGYVIVETDYLSGMPGIARDAERMFGIEVVGWCTRKERHPVGDGVKLLPPDSDDYDPDGTNDMNHNNYLDAVYSIPGWCYAIMQVHFPSHQA